MAYIHFRVSDAQASELKNWAKEAKKDVSAYIRDLLFNGKTSPEEQAKASTVTADDLEQATTKVEKSLNDKLSLVTQTVGVLSQQAAQNRDEVAFDNLLLQQILVQKIIRDKSVGLQKTAAAVNYAQSILNDAYDEANRAFSQQQNEQGG